MTLVFHRMDRILEIDPENMCGVVQPGVVNGDFQKEVARFGLMYPPDPASMYVATIGGNVALNAGGPRGWIGVTGAPGAYRRPALGRSDSYGGKTLKNVSGYDLTRLFCGSEGTLGIFTEIILKLIPLPPAKATLQAVFSDLDDAAKTVSAIIGTGIVPTTLELMDRVVLEVIGDYGGAKFHKDAEALLLIEVDGEPGVVEQQGKRIEKLSRREARSPSKGPARLRRRRNSGRRGEPPSGPWQGRGPTASSRMRPCRSRGFLKSSGRFRNSRRSTSSRSPSWPTRRRGTSIR